MHIFMIRLVPPPSGPIGHELCNHALLHNQAVPSPTMRQGAYSLEKSNASSSTSIMQATPVLPLQLSVPALWLAQEGEACMVATCVANHSHAENSSLPSSDLIIEAAAGAVAASRGGGEFAVADVAKAPACRLHVGCCDPAPSPPTGFACASHATYPPYERAAPHGVDPAPTAAAAAAGSRVLSLTTSCARRVVATVSAFGACCQRGAGVGLLRRLSRDRLLHSGACHAQTARVHWFSPRPAQAPADLSRLPLGPGDGAVSGGAVACSRAWAALVRLLWGELSN
mmetsp:Transcript_45054/g.134480  ORF Transcript_45054/g.134480 Transcript_45054/m.134480 type:complete len:284 (-) Transcript_45054:24-875(-)